MNSLVIRTVILWIHAVAGAGWVGASACYVIAAGAVGIQDDDGRAFVRRVTPAVNRVAVAAMLIVVASGIVNLMLAGSMRQFHFSRTFIAVLSAKIAIFLVMFALLSASFRAARRLSNADSPEATRPGMRLLILNGAVVAMGAAALVLGLWLVGS
jgi:hypothetical protein